MSHKDVDYYQRRAEAEIELAQRSDDARAVRVHYEMAWPISTGSTATRPNPAPIS